MRETMGPKWKGGVPIHIQQLRRGLTATPPQSLPGAASQPCCKASSPIPHLPQGAPAKDVQPEHIQLQTFLSTESAGRVRSVADGASGKHTAAADHLLGNPFPFSWFAKTEQRAALPTTGLASDMALWHCPAQEAHPMRPCEGR